MHAVTWLNTEDKSFFILPMFTWIENKHLQHALNYSGTRTLQLVPLLDVSPLIPRILNNSMVDGKLWELKTTYLESGQMLLKTFCTYVPTLSTTHGTFYCTNKIPVPDILTQISRNAE